MLSVGCGLKYEWNNDCSMKVLPNCFCEAHIRDSSKQVSRLLKMNPLIEGEKYIHEVFDVRCRSGRVLLCFIARMWWRCGELSHGPSGRCPDCGRVGRILRESGKGLRRATTRDAEAGFRPVVFLGDRSQHGLTYPCFFRKLSREHYEFKLFSPKP